MATEPTPEGGVAALVGRLSEMSDLTALATLDALIGAASGEDLSAAARQAKALGDRILKSAADLQDALSLS